LKQVVADDNLVVVFFHHLGRCVVVGGGELQQQVVFVLGEDALDGVFPTLEQFALRPGLYVHVMGFIGNQDDAMLAKVFKCEGVFLLAGQVGVEFLNGGKADVDVAGIDRFKVFDGGDAHTTISDMNVRIEQVLNAGGVEKVIFGFFDDVGGIDKEQEIAVVLLVEIEDQPRHDERLAAPCRHVEKKVQGTGFAREVIFVAMKKAGKGFDLVRAQFVFGV